MILKETGRNGPFFLSVLSVILVQSTYMPSYEVWSTCKRAYKHSYKFCTTYKHKYKSLYVTFLHQAHTSQNFALLAGQFWIKNPILLDSFKLSVPLHGLEVNLDWIMGLGLWNMVLS